MSYAHLKSGTDVRGIASDIFGGSITLTDNAVSDISSAFVCWLTDKLMKPAEELKIAVGHDSRISADRISSAVISSLVNSGVEVINCNLASTPAMFMTTVMLSCDAAIQITASHHPADRNGLKFFIKSGGLDGKDISEILALADYETCYISEKQGSISEEDFMTAYASLLREKICSAVGKSEEQKPLNGYKIVVDAGNGAGGFYATEVLQKLGADISGSQFLEPDGMFPNHIPNPENKDAMKSICDAVIKNKADLGIIFDTDVDRAGCVDKYGNEINRNRLIALASIIACDGEPGATIVTDSVTSDGLKTFIEQELGCKHYRYRRGYKNVIDKAKELCEEGIDSPLAIETSGHAALRENYFLDDGAYLVTKIVIELAKGKDFDKLLAPLKMPVEEREYRFNILDSDFKNYGEMVIAELYKYAQSRSDWKIADDNREGLRVSAFSGWFLLRLSVHDPVMPINFESDVSGGIDKAVDALIPFFKSFDKLDITGFN